MTYAHIYDFKLRADYEAGYYAGKHIDEVLKVWRGPNVVIVYLKNGDRHEFMSGKHFETWKMGREYMIGDLLYRSDELVM